MSNHGLFEHRYSSSHRLSGEWVVKNDGSSSDSDADCLIFQSPPQPTPTATTYSRHTQTIQDETYRQHRPTKRPRIHFHDFAAQARLQQHHERRSLFLNARQRVLQRSIALSARLRRTSSWIQDGLVEISRHQDSAGFARVFSYAQDLVDICYSHWNNDLQALDTAQLSDNSSLYTSTPSHFFDQLAPPAQTDLLDLLSSLRSNPQFLIERFRNLPRPQVATLTSKPKWEAHESFLTSFSQSSGRSQRQRRTQAYSRDLEDYALSFERSNPLSFLLHNLYGHDIATNSPESRLRLYTWSTICARLLETGADSYNVLYWQVLEAFSVMQDWPAKTRLELFLMDVLQRGECLLDVETSSRSRFGPLNTEQANEFFENAVLDLYWILIECQTGLYPPGALDLARAILGKLTHPRAQSDFRSHFFEKWYITHFLKAAIMYPENENMLLKIHVSKRARECILAPLFSRFLQKYENFMEPRTHNDENIRNIIEDMINMLDGQPAPNPYDSQKPGTTDLDVRCPPPVLVLCASEVVKTLEILSPQAIHSAYGSDPVMRELRYAFQANSRPNTRFDILKQELLQQMEAGTSAKDIHPCIETWTEFRVTDTGTVVRFEVSSSPSDDPNFGGPWTLPQRAALKLCTDALQAGRERDFAAVVQWNENSSLETLFQQQMKHCRAETQTVDFVFWKEALERLHREYPSTKLLDDDSPVLNKPFQYLYDCRERAVSSCATLEDTLGSWEKAYQDIRKHIERSTSSLEELRLKLWYTSEVINSSVYADARSIAVALSYMNLPDSRPSTSVAPASRASVRPGSSRSGVSSIFGQRRHDTIQLLKAPSDQGGSRKLADGQIEDIKRWLRKYNIDNFCKGEERLHRFCMEIQLVAKRLTGDNIVESGELWSSDLFQRERSFYDYSPFGINSAPASTRAVSVMSDSFSASYQMARPATRSPDSDVRSTMSDERSSLQRGSVYNMFARSLNPQILAPELASSISSYGRASSATTTASDIFSVPSPSVTEASVYSRAPSMLHGRLPNFATRPTISGDQKMRFREELRKGLVCLLLSDLGCIVWSWGCETDTWIGNAQKNERLMARCVKRISTKSLRPDSSAEYRADAPRRRSTSETTNHEEPGNRTELLEDSLAKDNHQNDSYLSGLQDVLERLSQHVDPVKKLQACQDFDTLALQQLASLGSYRTKHQTEAESEPSGRRNSLDSHMRDLSKATLHQLSSLSIADQSQPSHDQIVHHYKRQLAKLKPKTIFRDLQYIASFVPSEMLDNTAAGKALTHVGMAALDYKDELCGSMVDLADRMMAADINKDKLGGQGHSETNPPISGAAEYWMIAAVEGNPVAQRELAILYMMRPEILPIVIRPLWKAGDIFRDENMWYKSRRGVNESKEHNRQALCLALHWMQQAANNGDEIARKKLEERKSR